jgi:glycosyltransferase involved in cell wall biosynthesis
LERCQAAIEQTSAGHVVENPVRTPADRLVKERSAAVGVLKMRVLFLSNFYPPASRGGYEQWCQEVLDGLRSRGHEVWVLASDFGKDGLTHPDPAWVQRSLHLEMELASLKNAFQFFTHRKKREAQNLNRVRDAFQSFKPDVVLIWGMWNLHRSIPALIEELMPGRVAYYIGDYWPTLPNQFENYWNASPRNKITGLPKLMLKPFALQILAREKRPQLKLEHVLFPTMFMQDEFKQKKIMPPHTKTIYGAVDTRPYLNDHKKANSKLSLLYIGRLSHEKGVHTAIQAVSHLVSKAGVGNLHLTVVGDGEPDYLAYLQNLVATENVASFVDLQPAQPKEALPSLYQHADMFLFTSIWPEPFGRVIVEAMASGVAVIGTRVGGAAEILIESENALLFTPNDPVSLANQIKKLIELPELRMRLAQAGKESVVNKFDIQRMTGEIENYLEALTRS